VRYRLVGSHSADLFGDCKGAYLDRLGLPDGIDELLTQDYAYAAWAYAPTIGRYPWPKKYGCPATVEYGILPLLDDDRVCRFLAAEHISKDIVGEPLYPDDLLPLGRRQIS